MPGVANLLHRAKCELSHQAKCELSHQAKCELSHRAKTQAATHQAKMRVVISSQNASCHIEPECKQPHWVKMWSVTSSQKIKSRQTPWGTSVNPQCQNIIHLIYQLFPVSSILSINSLYYHHHHHHHHHHARQWFSTSSRHQRLPSMSTARWSRVAVTKLLWRHFCSDSSNQQQSSSWSPLRYWIWCGKYYAYNDFSIDWEKTQQARETKDKGNRHSQEASWSKE